MVPSVQQDSYTGTQRAVEEVVRHRHTLMSELHMQEDGRVQARRPSIHQSTLRLTSAPDTHTHTHTHTHRHRHRHRHRHPHTHTHTHTYTHTNIHTHTQTQTHTDTDTHRHTHARTYTVTQSLQPRHSIEVETKLFDFKHGPGFQSRSVGRSVCFQPPRNHLS